MARIICAMVFVLGAANLASQETTSPGCRPTAGQEEFFASKQRLDMALAGPRLGTLAPEFQQKLAANPVGGQYLYLYGRALMGKDTKQALVQLNRALDVLPKMPWTYKTLADIYASRNFYDPARLLENIRSYHTLCPGNLDGFQYLDKVSDAKESGLLATELRVLLESRSEAADGRYWRLLWGAEFRAASEADYATVRARVASDLKRLEDLAVGGNRDALAALMDGYKLTGDSEAAYRIEQRLDPDMEVNKEYEAWIAKTGIRTRGSNSPEERKAFNVEYARVAAEWVHRWPNSESAWEFRTLTLVGLPDSTREDVENAGLELLRLEALHDRGWTHSPMKLLLAQFWLRKGVRPADCVRMAEESLTQILQGPADANDMTGARGTRSFSFDAAQWDAMTAVADGSLQLQDFAQARQMLGQMQRWLDDNRAKKADSTSGYEQFRGRYLLREGALAEAKNHPIDALSFYIESIAAGWRDPEAVQHARALWDKAGGTEEGWTTLLRRPSASPATSAKPETPVAVANLFAAWRDLGQPLPDINLRDQAGKMRTLADFKGKTTLVSVWATWCGPCWDELPQLQRLHEMIQNRQDIQLVTISIDQNPGELEPFLASKRYTFPVIVLGLHYVEQLVGPVSIPRNWIVDSRGIVRQQSLGFDTKIADWPMEMVRRLENLR
jgi:peroxiredoxin